MPLVPLFAPMKVSRQRWLLLCRSVDDSATPNVCPPRLFVVFSPALKSVLMKRIASGWKPRRGLRMVRAGPADGIVEASGIDVGEVRPA